MYKTIFYRKCYVSPIRQKSPYRHADHKPNAEPPSEDTCEIWKESDQNCSVWKILKKSLLTT